MSLRLVPGRNRSAAARRNRSIRFRPALDGLEDRIALSTAAGTTAHVPISVAANAAVHTSTTSHVLVVHPQAQQHAAAAHRHAIQPHTHLTPRHPLNLRNRLHHGVAAPVQTTATATTTAAPAPAPAATTASTTAAATTSQTLVTLDLKPLDVNLLGLEVQTSEITVTVSAQPGSGELLGNLLTDVSGLLNLQGVNAALNNVLGSVVTLANSASLSVGGVNTTGSLGSSTTTATTPVLSLHIAPVNLNLLGAVVTTSPINLTITAHSGPGLVLGNVVTDLANLLNTAPKNGKLTIDYLNQQLQGLISQLNAQLPNVGGTTTTATAAASTAPAGSTNTQVLSLTVPPIDLNLLGLVLQTDQIQVNANAQSGSGDLLGNLLNDILNTAGATPQNLATLNSEVNTVLSKVVGVLNASSLTLAPGVVGSLSQVLQNLALPNLVNSSGTASSPVLNLTIAELANDTTPPVDVNLLGLIVTTGNIHAQLTAQTGNGQILGNLVYNVSHLLDPGGSLNLLTILSGLGI